MTASKTLIAKLAVFMIACFFVASTCSAELCFTTTATGNSNVGTYTQTISHSVNGITFDAKLVVSGSGDVYVGNNGLGVDGTKVESGESLTYSMVIENVVGGTIMFDGFTSFSNSTGAGSGAFTLRDDSNSTPGPTFFDGSTISDATPDTVVFAAPTLPYFNSNPLPTIFTATAGSAQNDNFRGAAVCATFSAVPEPSSLMMFGLVISTLACRRKR